MDYQVWTKDEYQELYSKVDCGDLLEVRVEIEKAIRNGNEPLLTAEVPYKYDIKIGEVGSEANKDKTPKHKGPGAESKGEVRSGDMGAVPALSEGSGDNQPDNSVPSK